MVAPEMQGRKPVVALVLASGGLKPFSALPLLEVLERENIPVELFVDASGGGIDFSTGRPDSSRRSRCVTCARNTLATTGSKI